MVEWAEQIHQNMLNDSNIKVTVAAAGTLHRVVEQDSGTRHMDENRYRTRYRVQHAHDKTNGTEAPRHEPEGEKWSVTFITGLVKMRKIAIGVIAYGEIAEATID